MCCSKLKLKFSLTVYICIAQYVVAINMSYTFEIAMLMYCLERNARFNIPGSTSQVATQTHRLCVTLLHLCSERMCATCKIYDAVVNMSSCERCHN